MPGTSFEITDDPVRTLIQFLNSTPYSSIGILVDENTRKHCYPILRDHLPRHTIMEIPSGEQFKTLQSCVGIWKWMTENNFDRKSLLINLGGGVIGDMGGFCAGTYKRGIGFINIPTTLLAMVDASVGGKLGVDFEGFKNHIGIFKAPEHVIISPVFLETLTRRELKSGYAEVIKHALIADRDHFNHLYSTEFDRQNWNEIIQRSVQIKEKIVDQDPEEKGLRKVLNFGHTIGHAIESFYLNKSQKLLHGEAIAIGMLCEACLSSQQGGLGQKRLKKIETFITDVFGHYPVHEKEVNKIVELIRQDKKNEGDRILCTFLKDIGKADYNHEISIGEARDSIKYYLTLKMNGT